MVIMEGVYKPLLEFVDFAMGPGEFPLCYVINTQKLGTFPFTLLLMLFYGNFSKGVWLYLALHGTYGWLWVLKDVTFPDQSFHRKVSLLANISTGTVLCLYLVLPWLSASGLGVQDPSGLRIAFSVALFAFGVSFMLVSDAQKYFTLKLKKGLIAEGMFKYTRNPNYFGEILIYLSFAVCVGHYFAYGVLASVWGTLFMALMLQKEKSYSQKEGWKEYKARSWMLLPKVVPWSDGLSLAVYLVGVVLVLLSY